MSDSAVEGRRTVIFRVSDPYPFNADPDPGFQNTVHVDQDLNLGLKLLQCLYHITIHVLHYASIEFQTWFIHSLRPLIKCFCLQKSHQQNFFL